MKKEVTVEKQVCQYSCDFCERIIEHFGRLSDTCIKCGKHMCRQCYSGYSTGAYDKLRCWCKSCYKLQPQGATIRELIAKLEKLSEDQKDYTIRPQDYSEPVIVDIYTNDEAQLVSLLFVEPHLM